MDLKSFITLGPARDKHSNLLRFFVNYGRKRFYNIGPCLPRVNLKAIQQFYPALLEICCFVRF
jgi:hypothetical protein